MFDPYTACHADTGAACREGQTQFWGEWTQEDARRVEAGGAEGSKWGECWQWPVVECVTDRILERYQDGWAIGMEQPRSCSHRIHHLHQGPSTYYNLPPTPEYGFSAPPPPTHPRQQLDGHRIALPNQARSMT